MDLQEEIKRALEHMEKRGMVQNNHYDAYTKYIYKTRTFDDLIYRTKMTCVINELDYNVVFPYALNRRYNNITSHYAEDCFTSHPDVEDEEDIYNRDVDFYIKWIPFDLKMSVYPKGFDKGINYALEHKDEMVEWLVKNASKGKRHRNSNRIFIVCYSCTWDHNRVKWNLQLVKKSISQYMENYSEDNLLIYNNALFDIIFITY